MIQLQQVEKRFGSKVALHPISLSIQQGEIYGIVGTSGAGKSTLLRIINLLERPTTGDVLVDGQNLTALTEKKLRDARKRIGMIFQHFNLVSNYTVFQNVEVALQLAKMPKQERAQRVMECLEFVGLKEYAEQYPANLSGGQKQRVAIARALSTKPAILLCDEPTSALDPSTTEEILSVLEMINRQLGVTIVIVSHELEVIKSICQKVTVLEAGAIYETLNIQPTGIHIKGASAQRFVDALKGGGVS